MATESPKMLVYYIPVSVPVLTFQTQVSSKFILSTAKYFISQIVYMYGDYSRLWALMGKTSIVTCDHKRVKVVLSAFICIAIWAGFLASWILFLSHCQ